MSFHPVAFDQDFEILQDFTAFFKDIKDVHSTAGGEGLEEDLHGGGAGGGFSGGGGVVDDLVIVFIEAVEFISAVPFQVYFQHNNTDIFITRVFSMILCLMI